MFLKNLCVKDIPVAINTLVMGAESFCCYTADGSYHFYVTDHLGNVRAVTDATGTIEKTFDYYPFGESYESVASANPGQDFRYGGKPKENKFGNREVYDFSARWYSPVFGRFQTMDPLCEKYYSLSPYAYCANNPMNNTDVTGCLIDDYLFNQSGQFLGVDETEHEDRIVIKDERGENVLSIMFADTEHDPLRLIQEQNWCLSQTKRLRNSFPMPEQCL